MTSKIEWRRRLRSKSADRSPNAKNPNLKGELVAHIARVLNEHRVQTVALFSPLQGEPDVTHIRSVYSPVTTFFPKVAHATELDFFEVQDVSELQVGAFGIQEPSGFGRSAKLSEIEAVLVPGLVFDRTGARLGRGRGYYDRALAEYQGLKIGVCCSDRVVEHLPTETFDVFMDYIVTDYFILRPLWAPTKGLH